MMKVTGSCHCGAVAYSAVVDPARVGICHCTDCQRLTGTAYRVTVAAAQSDFVLERGTPAVYVKLGERGTRRAQAFCPSCGSPLYTYDADAPEEMGLRVGGIDQRQDLVPRRQIWCRSALEWSMDIRSLPGRDRD